MTSFQFIKDYKDNTEIRKSFNALAQLTFGINFEDFYERGFWNERYIPYSFIKENQIISNVSIHIMDLIVNNEPKKAIQLGTVMTHPNYQKQGLAKALIKKIITEYQNLADFIYLFANESVLEFYPKFGFKAYDETSYQVMLHESSKKEIRPLNLNTVEDYTLFQHICKNKAVHSKQLDTLHDEHLLNFYCINFYQNNIYYIEQLNTIIIMEEHSLSIDLFSILSLKPIIFEQLIPYLPTKQINLHFTTDYKNVIQKQHNNNHLFMLNVPKDFPKHFQFPVLSQG